MLLAAPSVPRPAKFASAWKFAVWFIAALCVCAAIYLVVLSTVSFASLRSMALSAVPPGYEDRFTSALYSRIIVGLRLLASTLSIVSVALIVFAEPLSRSLIRIGGDTGVLIRAVSDAVAGLRRDPLHLIALSAVLAIAVALRLAFLSEPIRKDESYTFMYYASRPIFVGLTYYTVNNHMLNTLLMHISTSLLGASVWTLRLPNFLASILLVVSTYAATRLYHGKNAGLLAAALASGSSPLIEYSFNARGYTFGALFFMLMIVLVGLAAKGLKDAFILLPFAAALALYSVPTMMYGVAGVYLYLVLRRCQLRETVIAMLGTGALTLLLYTPVFATVGLSALTHNRWVIPVPLDQWPAQAARELISLWIYWNLDLPKVMLLCIAFGSAALFLVPKSLRLPPAAILLCVLVVVGVMLPIQRLVPFRRTWLFLIPLCFGCAGAGWSIVLRKLKSRDVLAALLALTCAGYMGGTVLAAKSLRYSGIEAAGGRGAEAIVLAMKPYLLQGAQFICSDSFDSPLDFEMYIHKIPYRPSPEGELLIVTPIGQSPQRTLAHAEIPANEIGSMRKIARYADQDVYVAQRGAGLPFAPGGTTEMGEFKTTQR